MLTDAPASERQGLFLTIEMRFCVCELSRLQTTNWIAFIKHLHMIDSRGETSASRSESGKTVWRVWRLAQLFCEKASSAVILSHWETSARPTHPKPSRSLVGRLLDLNPLQCHIVDGSFLDFLPPVLHRALRGESKRENVKRLEKRWEQSSA